MRAWLLVSCVVLGVPGTAKAAPCEALPSAAPEAAAVRLDVDGDGATDTVVPTECDGKTNCTLAIFLRRKGCLVAFGSVKGSPRALARSKQLLALTSRGIRLVATQAELHRASAEAIWAWSGDRWIAVYRSYRSFDANRPDDSGPDEGVPADAAGICLAGREAGTLAGGSDTRFAIHHVACTAVGELGCGNWLTVARGTCHAPVALLADGRVEVVQPSSGEQPAVLRVRNGKRLIEYRIAASADAPPVFSLVAERSCAAGQCGGWTTVTQPPPME